MVEVTRPIRNREAVLPRASRGTLRRAAVEVAYEQASSRRGAGHGSGWQSFSPWAVGRMLRAGRRRRKRSAEETILQLVETQSRGAVQDVRELRAFRCVGVRLMRKVACHRYHGACERGSMDTDAERREYEWIE
jgi:hypothetical protein